MKRAIEATTIILAITIFASCGRTQEKSQPSAPETASSKPNSETEAQKANNSSGTTANNSSGTTANKVEDTPANRRQAVERYLRIVPPVEMMREMTDKVAETLPKAQQERFKQVMTQEVDIKRIETAITDSMVKRFTVGEIDALTQFYGSPEGKSVMKKLGLYTADIMPTIQAESAKAIAKLK